MAAGKPQRPFNSNDFDVFIKHYRGDMTMTEAAEAVGFHYQTVARAVRDAPDWKAEIIEARELKARRRGEKSVQNIVKIADTEGHKDEFRANLVLAETYDDDFRPTQRIEVTGAEGQPLELEGGRRPVSIHDVAQLAAELGIRVAIGIDGGSPRGILPAAEDVLPDPPLDQ